MTCLYITEHGSSLSIKDGYFVVESRDGSSRKIPQEILESVALFGNANVSVPCTKRLLSKGIPVSYFSSKGHYFGKLESTSAVSAKRLKKQVFMSENEDFKLGFTKNILYAKVHNQHVLLQRYSRYSDKNINNEINNMKILKDKIKSGCSVEQIMGYEGSAAKYYFQALSYIIKDEFHFKGRSRRPPKDKFNSMLSLGYTILMYEIFAEISARGLTPYIGFIHKDDERHPTLASDMLEEWRAVIVDSVVMSLIQGNEINSSSFYHAAETNGVFFTKEGLDIFITKLEKKLRTSIKYLAYLDNPVSFRKAIWWQISNLVKAIEDEDYSLYKPLMIR